MRLIMVPGLGDNVAGFRAVLPLWRVQGFKASVFSFNWRQDDGGFENRLRNFLTYVRPWSNEKVVLLGASAGGTVVANALLERPDWITRAVAIAAPLWGTTSDNRLLNASVMHLKPRLERAEEGMLQNLASYWGTADETVPPHCSHLPGGANRMLYGAKHSGAILRGLTRHSFEIGRWLRTGETSLWMHY